MQVTIFADGENCTSALSKRLRKGRATIALDGAAERARKDGWVPDFVLGDFDSVPLRTLRLLESHGSLVIPTPDQNFTDLEKAVQHCLERYSGIWIAQAFGSRVDHSFTALSLLSRYHRPKRDFTLWRNEEKISLLQDEARTMRGRKGRRLAVLPFPSCRITSQGLEYELQNRRLRIGAKESACNHARTGVVELKVEGTALLVQGF